MREISVGGCVLSNQRPLVLIGGLNVLESYDMSARACAHFAEVCSRLGMAFIFKGSFDKANRSSGQSYRGVGLEAGMAIFERLRREFAVPLLTDVHEPWQCAEVAGHVDMLQLPAFLARQSDLVAALAATGRPVLVKKPQFMSPAQMANIVEKFRDCGNEQVLLCERGTCFGYDNLVVDMLGFGVMKRSCGDAPVALDVTHALQCRDPQARSSGGRRSQALELARAGVALGLAAVFIECHEDPELARCDGPSALPLALLEPFVRQLRDLDALIKSLPALSID